MIRSRIQIKFWTQELRSNGLDKQLDNKCAGFEPVTVLNESLYENNGPVNFGINISGHFVDILFFLANFAPDFLLLIFANAKSVSSTAMQVVDSLFRFHLPQCI